VKIVLDTNIVISALLIKDSAPGQILSLWLDQRFSLLVHEIWLAEISHVTRRPHIRQRILPQDAGRLINLIKAKGLWLDKLPDVSRSPDPNDNFLLAMAQEGKADFVITGDKSGLLSLGQHGPTRILSPRAFLDGVAAR
jgi:uncharacterized protein